MFWGQVLNDTRYSPLCRILMMLGVIPAQIALGVIVSTAPHELYPVYSLCGRAFGGLSPLDDQHIGGLILWIPAAMMSAIGILVVLGRDFLTLRQTAGR
jgi:putative membrane protein